MKIKVAVGIAVFGLVACGENAPRVNLESEVAAAPQTPPPPVGDALASQDECAGLVPDRLPRPVTVQSEMLPPYLWPMPPMADGAGVVALPLSGHMDSLELRVYRADGTALEPISTHHFAPVAERSGFIGVQNDARSTPTVSRVVHYGVNGDSVTGDSDEGVRLQAADPRGGLVTLLVQRNEVESWDSTAGRRWSTKLSIPMRGGASSARSLAVDRAGNTLVLFDAEEEFGPKTLGGVWLTSTGRAGRPFLAAENVAKDDRVSVAASATEGVFLNINRATLGRQWEATLNPRSPFVERAPRWLGKHGEATPLVLGKGNGYALRVVTDRDDECAFAVLGPSGKSCGQVAFRTSSRQSCAGAELGVDGTVIVLEQPAEADCEHDRGCKQTWTWWPAALK